MSIGRAAGNVLAEWCERFPSLSMSEALLPMIARRDTDRCLKKAVGSGMDYQGAMLPKATPESHGILPLETYVKTNMLIFNFSEMKGGKN